MKCSFEYYDKLKTIENIIPKNRITVRVFEKRQFQGKRRDVLSVFLYVLSMGRDSINEEDMDYPARMNESFSRFSLSGALLFNVEFNRKHGNVDSMLLKLHNPIAFYEINNVGKESHFDNTDSKHYLAIDEGTRLLKHYKEGNASIARQYFNRNDGQLFYDEEMNYPVWEPYIFSEEERRIIKLWANHVAQISQTVETLQDCCEKGGVRKYSKRLTALLLKH
ncbi:MAG: hypothetical protein E7298_09945 [Lachnospiraceae bacterium]|nr:hypothetical protein [Lachnospiraceae bacterium]